MGAARIPVLASPLAHSTFRLALRGACMPKRSISAASRFGKSDSNADDIDAYPGVPAVRVKASASAISAASRWDSTKHAVTNRRRGRAARCDPHNRRRLTPTKTREKNASAGKANALLKPLHPSEELAAVVGSDPLPRGQVVSKMWEYIRLHNLQNPENRREILADDKLRRVFGKDKVTMFEMNKHLAGHLK